VEPSEGKSAVRDYWEAEPCAAGVSEAPFQTPAFYRDVAAAKDRLDPERVAFAGFDAVADRDVLEIGIGLGVDFMRFARGGARATGVDLTLAAVDSARALLELEGLEATVLVADAEALPFDEQQFDVVYSWGVLHHTPDTAKAVQEVHRVLRHGGEARIMLYALDSPFAGAVWLRQLARERRPLGMRAALSRGLESPGTQAFTSSEVKQLFAAFDEVELTRVVTAYDRRVLGPLARVGNRGWFHLIRARKR